MGVSFEVATIAHVDAFAPLMRPECVRDVLAGGRATVRDGLLAGLASDVAYAAVLDGEVMAMFGAFDDGGVWVLTSLAVKRHPREFLRACRPALELLFERTGHLTNFVDSRFVESIRWLKWLGCEVGEPVERRGALFHPVTIRKESINVRHASHGHHQRRSSQPQRDEEAGAGP